MWTSLRELFIQWHTHRISHLLGIGMGFTHSKEKYFFWWEHRIAILGKQEGIYPDGCLIGVDVAVGACSCMFLSGVTSGLDRTAQLPAFLLLNVVHH